MSEDISPSTSFEVEVVADHTSWGWSIRVQAEDLSFCLRPRGAIHNLDNFEYFHLLAFGNMWVRCCTLSCCTLGFGNRHPGR